MAACDFYIRIFQLNLVLGSPLLFLLCHCGQSENPHCSSGSAADCLFHSAAAANAENIRVAELKWEKSPGGRNFPNYCLLRDGLRTIRAEIRIV